MKFDLEGKIVFSKDLNDDAKKAVIDVIKDADKIFLKGVPKGKEHEASKIVDYNIEGNILKLRIISGRYSRAHDAIIRLKKQLAQRLGKEFKIGARKVEIDKYVVEVEGGRKDIKIPECKVNYINDKVILIFENLSESDLKRNIVDRAIKLVLKNDEEDLTKTVCKIPPGTVIRKYKSKRKISFIEPTELAEQKGWIKKFPGRGQWIYLHLWPHSLELLKI